MVASACVCASVRMRQPYLLLFGSDAKSDINQMWRLHKTQVHIMISLTCKFRTEQEHSIHYAKHPIQSIVPPLCHDPMMPTMIVHNFVLFFFSVLSLYLLVVFVDVKNWRKILVLL